MSGDVYARGKGRDLLPDFILKCGYPRVGRIFPAITPRLRLPVSRLSRFCETDGVGGRDICPCERRRKVDREVSE